MTRAARARAGSRVGGHWPARIAVLLVSSAVSFGAAELYVRWFHADEIDREKLEYYARASNLGPIVRAASNPQLVYELRPELDIEWMQQRLLTNEDGRRVSPHRSAAAAPDIRVALVGDSVPFGWGVAYDQSYGAVLERMLNEHTSVRTEVRNFAVPGYNIQHNRVVLRDRVLDWKPDLVILHYDHNDTKPISDNAEGYMGPSYGDNPLGSAFVKFALRRAFTLRTQWFSQHALPDEGDPNLRLHGSLLYGGPQYEWHLAQLRELGELLQDEGVPAMAFIFFAGVKLDDSLEDNEIYVKLHKPIQAELRAQGFTVVDSYLVMQDYLRERGWSDMRHTWLHPTDNHPNADTHRVFARALFDAAMGEARLARIFRADSATRAP